MNESDLRDLVPPDRPLPATRREDMEERIMARTIQEQPTRISQRVSRRVVLAAVAAVLVVVGIAAALATTGDDRDRTVTVPADSTEATEPPTTGTDAPPTTGDATTTTPDTSTPDTTTGTAPTTTRSSPSGSDAGAPSATPRPGRFPIRELDFANEAYVQPCPSLTEQDVTLRDGSGTMETVPDENGFVVELQPVVYGDADGDGDEDAMVTLFCHHQRADAAAIWVGVFGVSTTGDPLAIGGPLRVPNATERAITPAPGRVTVRVYAGDEPSTSLLEQHWAFADGAFRRLTNEPLQP
jgi:hypothetical protein